MTSDEFRKHAHELVDWMAAYMDEVEKYPVKSSVKPGEVFTKLPDDPPVKPESFESFMKDLDEIIMPGMSHWQSPNFYAYFPANTSGPSILAEMITATLGAQCMIWETSPAATELEEKMMIWLRDLIKLPNTFEGVIQDSASTSTLAAILTAREKATDFRINEEGAASFPGLRIYCSEQTHSSIEKAVKISGIGRENMVKIPVRKDFTIDVKKLREAIENDKSAGLKPCCVIATLGTTGTTAIDPLKSIGRICAENGIWFHVDAAMGGTALILPEYQWMLDGKEFIDSIVFNPHKWMFTGFDCSAYFVKNPAYLIRTFEILPEYLRTRTRGEVNDYRDWGIPLGRRFRALKLWSVMRMYGVEGLRDKVRGHIRIAKRLAELIIREDDFQILAPVTLNVVCFRYRPAGKDDDEVNRINETLNHRLNDTGKIYLTHTTVNGIYTLRMVIGQTNVTPKHVEKAWKLIMKTAREL
ncbi:MAG TPA: aminotransferase class I/II-fold pyridoxal phosphate-dependent enzyme [Bacteroidales bacterium]|nr:aminotransferase class I/II-fold pyridoxal phosphate-dependent enzyme [Bacteroidales bacterium]